MLTRRRLFTSAPFIVALPSLAIGQEAAIDSGHKIDLTADLSKIEQEIIDMDDEIPPLPMELASQVGVDEYFSMDFYEADIGTNSPTEAMSNLARLIIDSAPFNCRPIDVALYYRNVGHGIAAIGAKGKPFDFGEEGRPFARSWPHYYNPIVVEFFRATSLDPLAPGFNGDATPWCAAFLNYCIERSGTKDGTIPGKGEQRGTKSASSGSFRCFAEQVPLSDAREGDIVVFAKKGSINGCAIGQGHVAFFLKSTGSSGRPFILLGGNQTAPILDGSSVDHRANAIVAKSFPTKYGSGRSTKGFHSIRSAEFLRSA